MMALGRTWIVLLDDSRARFFVREGSGRLTEAAPELKAVHAKGAGPEARRKEHGRFILAVVGALDTACDRAACERIMLVGPERMLSTMRKAASDKIRARLWREMAAELTGNSEADLAQRLAPHFR